MIGHPNNAHTEHGARRLAKTIADYWAARGGDVNVRVSSMLVQQSKKDDPENMFVVRSDMVNGLPSRFVEALAA